MNIVLFEPAELEGGLPRQDRRAQHVLQVLQRSIGDTFDAGIINGPRGRATIANITPDKVSLIFDPMPDSRQPAPVTVLVGLPRPQTARDILRDATTLGVSTLHFVVTERGDANYAQSTLWSSGEWRRHLILGAEQAFDTQLPTVTFGRALPAVLGEGLPAGVHIALDNYESPGALSAIPLTTGDHVTLAVGPERGWSARERDELRAAGFQLAHLGTRVLRTETAVLAAITIVRARLGLM